MEKSKKEKIFRDAPVGKAVFTLVIPTVLSQIITVVYNIADTFFIGQQNDPDQVAAATVIMPVFIFLTAFANLFGIGGASAISRCLGAGDRKRAAGSAAFCVRSAAVLALVYGMLLFLLKAPLLPLLGANEASYDYCCEYMLWTVGIGAVPTVMNVCLSHLVRSEGYSGQAGFGVALGGILNILLDPVFIILLHLGVGGAAIATMLSNTAAALYFVIFLHRIRENTVISFDLRRPVFSAAIAADVLRGGLPSFIMTLMSTVSNMALNHLVASSSNEAVAGMGIAKKIDSVAYSIAFGMAQGVLPLIGFNYAAGNRERTKKCIGVSFFSSIAISVVGMIMLFFLAPHVVSGFIGDESTVAYGQRFLRIICLACPTTAANFMIITVFQATGAGVRPLILSLLRKGSLDVPLMFLLYGISGSEGIAWATPAADLLAMITALCMFIPYMKSIEKRIDT